MRQISINKILIIYFLVTPIVLYAETFDDSCKELTERLKSISCDESLERLRLFIINNSRFVESYELIDKDEIYLFHETLDKGFDAVQDCLIKHAEEPRHKLLIQALSSIDNIVGNLRWWTKSDKKKLPIKDSLLENHRKAVDALFHFTNNNGA